MDLLEGGTYWESTLSEGGLCCSAKSLRYLFDKSLAHIFFGKIIAKAWLKIYCIADVELSSNNLDFDQNIFDEALFELNKEVESLSGQ